MFLLATIAATAGFAGSTASTTGAESVGALAAVQPERAHGLRVIANRLQAGAWEGMRVSSLGSRHPVKLSRPLVLTFNEANRMAGWIANLQQGVQRRMGDTVATMSLFEVTEAEAALQPFAFAIDQRWFAVEHLGLRYAGRMAMSDPATVGGIVADTACRFMTRVSATVAAPGSCVDTPERPLVVAGR